MSLGLTRRTEKTVLVGRLEVGGAGRAWGVLSRLTLRCVASIVRRLRCMQCTRRCLPASADCPPPLAAAVPSQVGAVTGLVGRVVRQLSTAATGRVGLKLTTAG